MNNHDYQPPPRATDERPIQTLARLLKEAGAIHKICGIPIPEEPQERFTAVLDRLKALEAENAALREQLAAAETRLAMVVEALEAIHKGACLTAQESKSRDDDRYCLADVIQVSSKALTATAEAVAAWRERVKAEGAAEELERIYAGKGSSTEFDPEYLLRRAVELRRKTK